MAVVMEEQAREQAMWEVVRRMMAAARTAPKGCGIDSLVIASVGKDEIKLLMEKMAEVGEKGPDVAFFKRDAGNIAASDVVVLLGTRIEPRNIARCGMCGYANCAEKRKHPDVPCAFNTGDLGIAVGSAVSVAMDCRVDNRVMFTIGQAAVALKMLGEDVKIAYGIPLSCTEKNPFFDRKAK
jgi:uncharacterized ferredoxin-like protein